MSLDEHAKASRDGYEVPLIGVPKTAEIDKHVPEFHNAAKPRFALSVRQPWAWLIIHAGKDIENRTWSAKFRGRILIHAAKGITVQEYGDAIAFMNGMNLHTPLVSLPRFDQLERGGIIGEVDIIGCVTDSQSPWFVGPCGFVLKNPKPLPFVPCKGALGFFRLPEEVKV